ncbi:EKC/KEOPS complex subunit [Tolypocladium ophioglossoides CBS 100239]|uniref:EKC/KEOPS complex subunit CGI121 n=1 Tax=Tolypocladium ophioglossoides (strain CBS 100239) TaxID=1163406 RepID=A0A0L0NBD5_TOLOC|nr:EKC/KEOPS complex subunit [Tolypocladium ophioglossoides CBS 100239]
MSLETVVLEHLPASHTVYLALFRDVKNAAFLHQQLLDRNGDFEYAFVDASVVVSRRQLLSAVFKAVLAVVNGGLKTSNVHSEIVTSLSASNNIADAYRRFGISPSTKDLVVVKVTFPTDSNPEPPSGGKIWQHLKTHVQGDVVDVTDDNIAAATDIAKVRKYYKLNGLSWVEAIKDEKERRTELEMLILSGMALRGV